VSDIPLFRLLTRDEFSTAISWAAAEWWNPGHHDADAFWAADPSGFYGMFLDGELIGTASIVSYAGRLGFVGLFIVKPEWRGRGWGTQFWEFFIGKLSARLEPDAPMALDGVFTMQPYYARSGFVFLHRNLRMEGKGIAGEVNCGLRDLREIPQDHLANFDARFFGVPRQEFLRRWISPEGGLGLASISQGEILGIGVVRPCLRGFKIGPLFAESEEIAEEIFCALSHHAADSPLFLDIPEVNPDAQALAARHGFREVFGCARMVRGSAPDLPWRQIFGVTTFELG